MISGQGLRRDLSLITTLVPAGSNVLDVGCGDGLLLSRLQAERDVQGYGLEIDGASVATAVSRGLSVVQGDADTDLGGYPEGAFDVVILSNSLQALKRPDEALESALRIGKRLIVTFPNFAHWRLRLHLLLTGTMPQSRALPATWYSTNNIHLCTIKDFLLLAKEKQMAVLDAYGLRGDQHPFAFNADAYRRANLLAEAAVFVIERR